jgi:hypothetical protein
VQQYVTIIPGILKIVCGIYTTAGINLLEMHDSICAVQYRKEKKIVIILNPEYMKLIKWL